MNEKIEYDNKQFELELKKLWPHFKGRTVCSVDENGNPLGGFGFINRLHIIAEAYVLKIKPGWASRKLYYEALRFPFVHMKCAYAQALVEPTNKASLNICKKFFAKRHPYVSSVLIFEKDTTLERAEYYAK